MSKAGLLHHPFHSVLISSLIALLTACGGGSGGGGGGSDEDGTIGGGSGSSDLGVTATTGEVETRLAYTSTASSGSGRALKAVDPDRPQQPVTISEQIPDEDNACTSAVAFGTWTGDTDFPGTHFPYTVFNTTEGELFRVNLLPDADAEPERFSDENDATSIARCGVFTDYESFGDSRLLYQLTGETTAFYSIAIGADTNRTPTKHQGQFVTAYRGADGSIEGMVVLDGNQLRQVPFGGGEATVLSDGVDVAATFGFVDDRHILIVDGRLHKLDPDTSDFNELTTDNSLADFNFRVQSPVDSNPIRNATQGFEQLYNAETNDAGSSDPATAHLVEVDLDTNPEARSLEQADNVLDLGGQQLGSDRIAWIVNKTDGNSELRSINTQDGNSTTLDTASDFNRFAELIRANEVAVNDWVIYGLNAPRYARLDGGAGPDSLFGGEPDVQVFGAFFSSDSAGSAVGTTQAERVIINDQGSVRSVSTGAPNDRTQDVDLGEIDVSQYQLGLVFSHVPNGLLRLDYDNGDSSDIAVIRADESGGLTFVVQDQGIDAEPVTRY